MSTAAAAAAAHLGSMTSLVIRSRHCNTQEDTFSACWGKKYSCQYANTQIILYVKEETEKVFVLCAERCTQGLRCDSSISQNAPGVKFLPMRLILTVARCLDPLKKGASTH